jgi:agmatine deiminase
MFAAIIAAISRFELVILLSPDKDAPRQALLAAGADLHRIVIVPVPTNDTWARDFGPITVHEDGRLLHLDFTFNGWGGKFQADLDNAVNRQLAAAAVLQGRTVSRPLVLEGGSIESDGRGTLLVTGTCLLNRNRNPELTRAEIEHELAEELGATRILWLHHGHLAGDDTDAHIDTLARLCPDDTIVYVACRDRSDEHYPGLAAMEAELVRLRTSEGSPYRLLPVPLPAPCFDEAGERLPATYANFLVINGAVLVPTYGDPHDAEALSVLAAAFPGREIIGIDCRPAVLQHGSLHCLTMQLPKGSLS